MADLPMLMAAPMVRACLREARQAGTGKSHTRRLLKLPTKGEYVRQDMDGWEQTTVGGGGAFMIGKGGTRIPAPEKAAVWNRTTGTTVVLPFQVGDRLWVRETIRAKELSSGQDGIEYLADGAFHPIDNSEDAAMAWLDLYHYRGKRGLALPPMHMPRRASRLTLLATAVKVERLQEISEEDARAEGIVWCDAWQGWTSNPGSGGGEHYHGNDPRQSFSMLWQSLYGPDSWDANPHVVAVTFTPHYQNIDQLPQQPASRDAPLAPAAAPGRADPPSRPGIPSPTPAT